jgi:hypothetical protein
VAADTDEQDMSDEDRRVSNKGHWGEFEDFTTPDGQTGRGRKWVFTDPRHPSYQGGGKDDKQETDNEKELQVTKDRGGANSSLVQDSLRDCGDHRGADHGAGDISDRSSVVRTVETELAESKNAHGENRGQTAEKQSRESGNAHGKISGHFRGQTGGQIPVTSSAGSASRETVHEMPTKNAHGKISGHFGLKSVGKSENAHGFQAARTEWFRYEMNFRDRKKGGHQVLIRRRLKWSDTRYAPTIASCYCADLTKRMVDSIKDDGKFTHAAIAALQNGGISHEIIKRLLERIGRGNGKRAAELTDHERSVLARIESGLAAGGGRRNASAGGKRRRLDFPRADVPNPHDGEFTEVPNVH